MLSKHTEPACSLPLWQLESRFTGLRFTGHGAKGVKVPLDTLCSHRS